jgi:hypothetical protein
MKKKTSRRKQAPVLVTKYGRMWAKNSENMKRLLAEAGDGRGVYVLYDGSMPMYVGKGVVYDRIAIAKRSTRRKEFWDHFSWYLLADVDLMHDVEVLLLRTLPPYLRSLTNQSGKLKGAERVHQKNKVADPIARKRSKKKKRRGKK